MSRPIGDPSTSQRSDEDLPQMQQATLITPNELHNIIRQHEHSFMVIDVRDDDFVGGGHLPNYSVNIPSTMFVSQLSLIIRNYVHHNILVFHCLKSQFRGPKLAQLFVNRVNELIRSGQLVVQPQSPEETGRQGSPDKRVLRSLPSVYVLQGGFQSWVNYVMTSNDILDKSNYIDQYQHQHYWAGDQHLVEYRGVTFTPSQKQRELFQSIDTRHMIETDKQYAPDLL